MSEVRRKKTSYIKNFLNTSLSSNEFAQKYDISTYEQLTLIQIYFALFFVLNARAAVTIACKNLILNMRPTNVTYFIDQIKEQLNILKTNIRIEKEVKIMENKDKKELEKRIKEVNASIESQIKVR